MTDKLACLILFALFLSLLGYAEWIDKNERAEVAAQISRFRPCDRETMMVQGPGMLDYCVHPDDR